MLHDATVAAPSTRVTANDAQVVAVPKMLLISHAERRSFV
jgi:hypothetical protein